MAKGPMNTVTATRQNTSVALNDSINIRDHASATDGGSKKPGDLGTLKLY